MILVNAGTCVQLYKLKKILKLIFCGVGRAMKIKKQKSWKYFYGSDNHPPGATKGFNSNKTSTPDADADARLKFIVVSANSIKIQFGLDYSEDQDKSKELGGPLYTRWGHCTIVCKEKHLYVWSNSHTWVHHKKSALKYRIEERGVSAHCQTVLSELSVVLHLIVPTEDPQVRDITRESWRRSPHLACLRTAADGVSESYTFWTKLVKFC